ARRGAGVPPLRRGSSMEAQPPYPTRGDPQNAAETPVPPAEPPQTTRSRPPPRAALCRAARLSASLPYTPEAHGRRSHVRGATTPARCSRRPDREDRATETRLA